jgi:RimJ/RimL family protein N-acetyltransferase
MLAHAFDAWGCLCVQLQTDALNERSRRAIERLGARLDGVLRSHRVCDDGRVRDSAVYSIVRDEWPELRARLFAR